MIAQWPPRRLLFAAASISLASCTAAPPPPPPGVDKATWAAIVDYGRQIAAHTTSFRKYPRMGQVPFGEGTVILKLVIARDGRLIDIKVVQSSGYSLIDGAELGAFWRSSPLPPPPPEIPGNPVVIVQPVKYQTR
jgi:periplasmic protein TonB